jgi:Cu/Ag efflux protein CusF
MRFSSCESCLAMLVLVAGAATAAEQPGKLPDPMDSRSGTPIVEYASAFADYRPFREPELRPWQEVNKEVADNPGMGHNMGAMKGMQHGTMPGADKQAAAAAPSGKESAAGHDMGAMKGMQHGATPGAGKQAAAPSGKQSAAGHDMGAMKGMQHGTMPGADKQAATAPSGKQSAAGHDMGAMKGRQGTNMMAMASPKAMPAQSTDGPGAGIGGTGVVLGIDRSNARIRLTHDPIAALDWPKMTMFFRLKEGGLAAQLREGDRVEFSLEKSASGFVISGLRKIPARSDMKEMK